MSDEAVKARGYRLMQEHMDRIREFEEEQEQQTGNELGVYPYRVIFDPAYETTEDPKKAFIDREFHEALVEENAMESSMDEASVREYRTLHSAIGGPERLDTMELDYEEAFGSTADFDQTFEAVMNEVYAKENPTLDKASNMAKDYPEVLGKSKEEAGYAGIEREMESYYEGRTSPSEQMELLIEQAEQDARQLDRRLDKVLELEEQGAINPLREQEAETTGPEEPALASRDRELLKDLFRRKQSEQPNQSTAEPSATKQTGGPELD